MAPVLSPIVVILVFSVLAMVTAAALAFFLLFIIRAVSVVANQRLASLGLLLLFFVLDSSFLYREMVSISWISYGLQG